MNEYYGFGLEAEQEMWDAAARSAPSAAAVRASVEQLTDRQRHTAGSTPAPVIRTPKETITMTTFTIISNIGDIAEAEGITAAKRAGETLLADDPTAGYVTIMDPVTAYVELARGEMTSTGFCWSTTDLIRKYEGGR